MIEGIKPPELGLPPGVDPRDVRLFDEPGSTGAPRIEHRQGGESSFAGRLSGVLQEVSELQRSSAAATQALVRGDPIELHEVVIRQEEARIAFTLLVETRNRIVSAYQEIMHMGV